MYMWKCILFLNTRLNWKQTACMTNQKNNTCTGEWYRCKVSNTGVSENTVVSENTGVD